MTTHSLLVWCSKAASSQKATPKIWQVAVNGATMKQNEEIAEVLKDELNKGVKLDDVLHAAKVMKETLASKLAAAKNTSEAS